MSENEEEVSSVLLEETKNKEVHRCTCCGGNYSIYKTYFSSVHLNILIKTFKWAISNKRFEFRKKELQNILTHTDYGNFYVLQRFGLIYYLKDDDGIILKNWSYWIPLKRVYRFLKGDFEIAQYFTRNTATGRNTASEEKITISGIKKIDQILKDGDLLPSFIEYEEHENNL